MDYDLWAGMDSETIVDLGNGITVTEGFDGSLSEFSSDNGYEGCL